MADWLGAEIEFRLGEMTEEEICEAFGISDVDALHERAVAGGWFAGIDTRAIHPKYILAVDEYMRTWDRKAACKFAGIPESRAAAVFKRQDVRDLVKRRMRESATRAEITQDAVLTLQWKIANADPRKLFDERGNLRPVREIDDDVAVAIAALEIDDDVVGRGDAAREVRTTKVKLLDRLGALRDVGKHLGMYSEKVEVTGKNGGPIETKATMSLDESARRIAFMLASAGRETKERSDKA